MKITTTGIMLLLSLPLSLAAAKTCQQLDGTYAGTYHDEGSLFPKGDFPIRMTLHSNEKEVIGVTNPSDDQYAANIGTQPFLFHAHCENGKLSKIQFIAAASNCGFTDTRTQLVKSNKTLTLRLHYQNAMIDTVLLTKLHRVPSTPADKLQLSHYAQKIHRQTPHSCH